MEFETATMIELFTAAFMGMCVLMSLVLGILALGYSPRQSSHQAVAFYFVALTVLGVSGIILRLELLTPTPLDFLTNLNHLAARLLFVALLLFLVSVSSKPAPKIRYTISFVAIYSLISFVAAERIGISVAPHFHFLGPLELSGGQQLFAWFDTGMTLLLLLATAYINHRPPSYLIAWVHLAIGIVVTGFLISIFLPSSRLLAPAMLLSTATGIILTANLIHGRILEPIQLLNDELRERELRYRAISDLTSDYAYSLSYVTDETFILDWAVGNLLMLTPGIQYGQTVSFAELRNLIDPADTARFDKHVAQVRANKTDIAELRVKRQDGSAYWVRSYAYPIGVGEDGHPYQIYVAGQDITAEKKALEALQSSDEQFRELVASISDHVFIARKSGNDDWHIAYSSPNIVALTGFPEEQFNDWGFWSTLIYPDDLPVVEGHIIALSGGQNSEIEYRISHMDGSLIWVRDSSRVNQDNDTLTVYGVVGDITERKRITNRMREAQHLERLGLLAGGIAHDFNNLLTGIMTQASLTQFKLPAGSPATPHVDKLIRAAQQAATLTQQLLAYAGKGRITIEKININQLTRECIDLLQGSLAAGVRFQQSLSPIPLYVEVDKTQLQQVLNNIILNAGESIQRNNGLITISTNALTLNEEASVTGMVGDKLLPPGDFVHLKIQDTGRGMDELTLKRIFDPFFSTKESGHGLGLSATLGIVQAHDGTIGVSSKLGEGTDFNVYLPLTIPPIGRSHQPTNTHDSATLTPSADGGKTILVIDDERYVREAVVDILLTVGLSVLTAASGAEGVELYRQHQKSIDLVLLDMRMPLMDGKETLQRLLTINKKVRVIMSSGFTEFDEETSRNIIDSLPKPYDAANLVDRIEEALN